MTPGHRRLTALLAAAAVAAVGGAALGAREDPAPAPRRPVAGPEASRLRPPRTPAQPRRAPLERAVGSLIVVRFLGPSLPGHAERALRAGRAGGVVLFRDNVVDPPQLRRLTRAIAGASGGRALVLVDQEGGPIRIVPWAGPEISAAAQLAGGRVEPDSRDAGRVLRESGVTVALAPVADVPSVAGAALAGRAFATETARAAAAVADAVRGFRAGGVLPTVKHFPGLGGATRNTDDAPAEVAGEPDLAPFAAAIDAGVPLVMVSHARFPALDADRIASQSRTVIEGLLRERLGFRGVVITDSLEAEASIRTATVGAAAERSVRAGVDLVLTTGRGSALPVYRRLLAAARRSPPMAARVRESARRVAALSGLSGLRP